MEKLGKTLFEFEKRMIHTRIISVRYPLSNKIGRNTNGYLPEYIFDRGEVLLSSLSSN